MNFYVLKYNADTEAETDAVLDNNRHIYILKIITVFNKYVNINLLLYINDINL